MRENTVALFRPIAPFRSMPFVRSVAFASLTLAGVLGGCASTAPTRFYTLQGLGPSSASLSNASHQLFRYEGPPLEVRAVQIPPSMDRLEMIRDAAPGQVDVREFDHWAAPLGRLARQALTEDLALRLPAEKVNFPGAVAASPPAGLTVDVLSFRIEDGTATMVASWSLRRPSTGGAAPASVASTASWSPPANADRPIVAGGSLRLQSAAGPGAGDTAQAWSELLAQVSDRVVAELNAR